MIKFIADLTLCKNTKGREKREKKDLSLTMMTNCARLVICVERMGYSRKEVGTKIGTEK